MHEEISQTQDDALWEPGFESNRRVLVSKLGPITRLRPLSGNRTKHFWQRIHELAISDWRISLPPLLLGSACTVETTLDIRFQPTLRYAREHLEFLPQLEEHIRSSQEPLIMDRVVEEIRIMESDPNWLDQGYANIERSVECSVRELLAICAIQSRVRCRIEARFADLEAFDIDVLAPWSRHRNVYQEALRRQREARQCLLREQAELLEIEHRHNLKIGEKRLEMIRKEEELSRARLEQEIERLRAEQAAEATRLTEQRAHEARLREEQIRQDASLLELEQEIDLRDKNRRAQNIDAMENHVRREIELLAMERQRLLLEKEVREVKIAKAKGWIINARKRFPLGEEKNAVSDSGAEIGESQPET